MNDIKAKLDALSQRLEKAGSKYSTGNKIISVAYVVVILIVIAYTTIITAKLREYATPKNVAQDISAQVIASLPKMQFAIEREIRQNLPMWTDRMMEQIYEYIPRCEKMVIDAIDTQADTLIAQAKMNYLPEITAYFKTNIKESLKNADILKDETLAKSMAHGMIEDIEAEMDRIINREFFSRLDALHQELVSITRKPKAQLTLREDAERRALLNSVFLVYYADYSKSILARNLLGGDKTEEESNVPLSDFIADKLEEEGLVGTADDTADPIILKKTKPKGR